MVHKPCCVGSFLMVLTLSAHLFIFGICPIQKRQNSTNTSYGAHANRKHLRQELKDQGPRFILQLPQGIQVWEIKIPHRGRFFDLNIYQARDSMTLRFSRPPDFWSTYMCPIRVFFWSSFVATIGFADLDFNQQFFRAKVCRSQRFSITIRNPNAKANYPGCLKATRQMGTKLGANPLL